MTSDELPAARPDPADLLSGTPLARRERREVASGLVNRTYRRSASHLCSLGLVYAVTAAARATP